MTDVSAPRLAKDILSYFIKHPLAADTCEGLARWRLLEEYVERTTRDTEKALDWLVDHGFLSTRKGAGDRDVFVLNDARRQDAETFVGDPAEEKHGER